MKNFVELVLCLRIGVFSFEKEKRIYAVSQKIMTLQVWVALEATTRLLIHLMLVF